MLLLTDSVSKDRIEELLHAEVGSPAHVFLVANLIGRFVWVVGIFDSVIFDSVVSEDIFVAFVAWIVKEILVVVVMIAVESTFVAAGVEGRNRIRQRCFSGV